MAHRLDQFIPVVLVMVVVALYLPVLGFDFINYDDPDYVVSNKWVQKGLTSDGTRWAFSTGFTGNWHPVTWFSHMLDAHLFGLNAAGHHGTNVVLHICNSLLLYLFLRYSACDAWPSAFVASLFALHPMNVEAVAWIAERKTLLSTFFGQFSLLAYVHYVRRRCLARYLCVMCFLTLGLMAKPLIVTLPFILLLWDFWPLDRLGGEQVRARAAFALVIEKLPLFVLVAISSMWAYHTAHSAGAVVSSEYSILARLGNAVVCYCLYIGKLLVPARLAVLYPHPGWWPPWAVLSASLILGLVTMVVVIRRNSQPYLLVGWFWYLGSLVPMIGIVQVSFHSMANRYAYTSFIGLFMMVACLAANCFKSRYRTAYSVVGMLILSAFAVVTADALRPWRNSVTLFSHALAVTERNSIAHNNLAQGLVSAGRPDEAIPHYYSALEIDPSYGEAHHNLGVALVLTERPKDAVEHFKKALRYLPDYDLLHFHYGMALARTGELDAGRRHLLKSLRISPGNYVAHYQLALVDLLQEEETSANEHLRTAIRLNPNYPDALLCLGELLMRRGAIQEAGELLTRFVAIRPAVASAHAHLGQIRQSQSRPAEALVHLNKALQLDSESVAVLNNLAWLLSTCTEEKYRDGAMAVQLAERACDLSARGNPLLLGTLAAAYAEVGEFPKAMAIAREASQLAGKQGHSDLQDRNLQLLELYEKSKPAREN